MSIAKPDPSSIDERRETERFQLNLMIGFKRQLPDSDPIETREWLEALDGVVESQGRERADFLLRRVLKRARQLNVGLPGLVQSRYINTISPEQEPPFPGDEEMEKRIRRIIRWNAAAMVVRANHKFAGLGGHLSTYASAASLYEVGFNHFFRGKDDGSSGDQVFFQGHAAPGIYSRAFLEGRLSESQLDSFRREAKPGLGLSSYPHPRLMPDFWEFPTVSMGLGAMNAIYQARFNRYLAARGLADTSASRVWAFLGDGETDEPEATGALTLAAREGLDNLTFVINCNLQRLDGPVRGNGKIIQELESVFRGAGWNVIKIVWGGGWDKLLAKDSSGKLLQRMEECVDGEYQDFKSKSGAYVREHFFGKYEELKALVADMSDDEIWGLTRGGHDPEKVFAAYAAAVKHTGQPTLILPKTVKGYGMGESGEGQMISHQAKKMTADALRGFRDRFQIPVSDDDLAKVPFVKLAEDSVEMKYLRARREALGGYLPQRRRKSAALTIPPVTSFQRLLENTGEREISTTMAFVQMLGTLVRDKQIGKHVVPIVPDESRTFGMEGMFRQLGIYSSVGQLYKPQDADQLMYYRESKDGQVLQEGINEGGAMSSWIVAATSYSTNNVPMIPFYIYYSMFGLQRVGDLAWLAGDIRARGFLLGGTAGRTTLNGEGLQHEDGHSLLLASAVPNCVAYDPAFAYEVAALVKEGLRRMFEKGEDIFYYLTLYNQDYSMPPKPEGIDEGLLKGLYRYRQSESGSRLKAQLFGSGPLMLQALRAQEMLAEKWDVAADVWSMTSAQQLRSDALSVERWNRLHPTATPRVPYVARALEGAEGPVVVTSDWVKSVNDMPARWIKNRFVALGTDGFGRSDTREALRRHFETDAEHMVVATLHALMLDGKVKPEAVAQAIQAYGLDPDIVDPRDA